MPIKATGQGRSAARSDAEESEIGHSSAGRRVRRRGRKVSGAPQFVEFAYNTLG